MINEKRLLDSFLDYVRIDSESRHEAAMAKRLVAELTALGCEVVVDDSAEKTGSDTGNVIATLPGNAPGEPISFFAHMDTVVPGNGVNPIVEDGVIRSSGDTVLGADDKSGVASVMEALRVVVENGLPHPTIQAVFTVCEEIGLFGAKHLDYSKLIAKRAVVVDTGVPGRIVIAAPGQYVLDATVHGLRAHAGGYPEKGVNAIAALSEGIASMRLGRIDKETTANVATFEARYPHNVVPDKAVAQFECRSRSEEKLEAQAQHMLQCLQAACDKRGAKLEYTLSRLYDPFQLPLDDPLVLRLAEVTRRVGREPDLAPTGGGSDAHPLNRHGVTAVIIGTGHTAAHALEEHISVLDLNRTAQLVLEMMKP